MYKEKRNERDQDLDLPNCQLETFLRSYTFYQTLLKNKPSDSNISIHTDCQPSVYNVVESPTNKPVPSKRKRCDEPQLQQQQSLLDAAILQTLTTIKNKNKNENKTETNYFA